MLRAEPNPRYDIYPSWADYKIKWHELPKLLADPLNSGLLDENDLRSIENGILPNVPEPCELIDGPAGGGIVITTVERPPGLNRCVLSRFAEVSAPMGVNFEVRGNQAHVAYLEPSRSLYLALGERRPRVYDGCAISFDHVEVAGDEVYWFVAYESGKSEISGLDEIPSLAAGFGLSVQRLDQPPNAVATETADWEWKGDRTYVWYIVDGGRDGIGFQYAIIVYIGLHLCKVAGGRFKGLHLIAQLESKVCLRKILAERRSAFASQYRDAENELRLSNPGMQPDPAAIVALVADKKRQLDRKSHGFVIKGQMGAASIEKLVERCRDAYVQQDFESLRALCLWTALGYSAAAIEEYERPVREIVRRFPLLDVVFEPSPRSSFGNGAKMVRYVEGKRSGRELIVAAEGRLILLGRDGRSLDPGYAAKDYEGRYYLSVADVVAGDVADALITGREPHFICRSVDEPRPNG
jgi:hypothetical protein